MPFVLLNKSHLLFANSNDTVTERSTYPHSILIFKSNQEFSKGVGIKVLFRTLLLQVGKIKIKKIFPDTQKFDLAGFSVSHSRDEKTNINLGG